MEYTILVTDNKELVCTHKIPIYVGENDTDKFRIIVPFRYIDTTPILQLKLPNGSAKSETCSFMPGLFKDKYCFIDFDITSVITEKAGIMQLAMNFIDFLKNQTTKTESIDIFIEDRNHSKPTRPQEGGESGGGGEPSNVEIASPDTLGVIMVGENLKIDGDGRLSVDTTRAVENDGTKPVTSGAV